MIHPSIVRLTVRLAAALSLVVLAACGTGAPSDDGPTGEEGGASVAAFPRDLGVASPFARGGITLSSADPLAVAQEASSSNYAAFADEVAAVLDGSTPVATAFDAAEFAADTNDAACYGPQLLIANHPDSDITQPDLPTGDLGLWTETEGESGDACAVAQLNARMSAVERQMLAAFTSLASLVVVADDAGTALPSAGDDPVDLTSAMNDAGIDRVTFNEATIGQGTDGTWGYRLDLSLVEGDAAAERSIVVELAHLETDTGFRGVLWFRSGASNVPGNCSDPGSGGGGGAVPATTRNASLAYAVDGDDVTLEARSGIFCGDDVDGRGSDGVLDVTVDSRDDANGWGSNFDIFTAEFAATSLAGSYAYSWQAGSGDRNARSLNVVATDEDGGTAFFGYAPKLQEQDAPVDGMICNWLGGGPIQDALQKQVFALSPAGVYVPEAGQSNITYAPVDDCSYSASETGGSFTIDEDLDGSLDDDVPLERTSDLVSTDLDDSGSASDADANGVLDVIENSGFEQPEAPSITVSMPY